MAHPPLHCDDFVYSGQLHDSVPRALLLDRRLSPLERNAWQVIRLLLNGEGITSMPTYEHLRPYLATSPCALQASTETVARALTVLRLCRWLSLARRRRPEGNGRWQGNLYVLHQTPLTPNEALRLDGEYLELLSQSLTHASKAVQRVAYDALQALAEDPLLTTQPLPEHLKRLAEWLENTTGITVSPCPIITDFSAASTSESEGRPTSDSEINPPASASEVGRQPSKSASLRNPKQGPSTVLSISKSFCIPRARKSNAPHLPTGFAQLRPEEQSAALATLQRIAPDLRQAVLNEWQVRCETGDVQRPANYLFGILQKALRGDFHPWAAQSFQPAAPTTATPEQQEAQRTLAHQHLAQLRKLLKIR